MTSPRPHIDIDPASVRHALCRALRPFVDGTAKGISTSVMTEARVAVTARDAAAAILPLLGTPAPSAHRVRRLIIPTMTCSWSDFEHMFEDAISRLLALPPAVPGVLDPVWDNHLAKPSAPAADWNDHGSAWSDSASEGDTVVGPSGTVGRVVRSDRRHALIVEDGRSVRMRAKCACSLPLRRERAAVSFELITFGRHRTVLDVRAGDVCAQCRAPM